MRSEPRRTSASAATGSYTDWLLGALLFAGALTWLCWKPLSLDPADEAFLLADALRMLRGERLYKDIFWLAMPGTHWALVAVFSVFGASLTVAKVAMAVVNAATAALTYATARALGVRPLLAVLPTVAFVALVLPVWPLVSAHWVSTALIMALFLAVAPPGALERPRRLLATGLTLGALGAVYQHKAPLLAIAVATAIAISCWVRRGAAAPAWWARLALVAGGTLVVVVPVLVVATVAAGLQPLFDDAFRFPLTGYRSFHDIRWGKVGYWNAPLAAYTSVRLLRIEPILLPLGAIVAGLGCAYGWSRRRVVQWSTALLLCGGALAAIGYNADFIHIAFMTAPLLVLGALLLETAVARLPAPAQAPLAALAAAAVLVPLGVHLARSQARVFAEFPVRASTPFGTVDFRSAELLESSEHIRALLDTIPNRRLFMYPGFASPYLTADGRNPTRHQILLPTLSLPQYYTETAAALAAQPTLIVVLGGEIPPGDPLFATVEAHYELVEKTADRAFYRWRERPAP